MLLAAVRSSWLWSYSGSSVHRGAGESKRNDGNARHSRFSSAMTCTSTDVVIVNVIVRFLDRGLVEHLGLVQEGSMAIPNSWVLLKSFAVAIPTLGSPCLFSNTRLIHV